MNDNLLLSYLSNIRFAFFQKMGSKNEYIEHINEIVRSLSLLLYKKDSTLLEGIKKVIHKY